MKTTLKSILLLGLIILFAPLIWKLFSGIFFAIIAVVAIFLKFVFSAFLVVLAIIAVFAMIMALFK